jgi:hypothetical protein
VQLFDPTPLSPPTNQIGWAKLQELRRYIELFRASGKFTVCWMKIATEKEYFLATAFEELYVPPSASIRLAGFAVAGAARPRWLRCWFECVFSGVDVSASMRLVTSSCITTPHFPPYQTQPGTFLRGVLDKVGVEPQVKRIGAYKSAGDQLLRKDMWVTKGGVLFGGGEGGRGEKWIGFVLRAVPTAVVDLCAAPLLATLLSLPPVMLMLR